MNRVVAVWTCVALSAAAGTAGQAQRGSASPNPQLALRVDLDGMIARVAAGPGSARQARADAQRLAVGYRGFGPLVSTWGPADYALNRQMARRSLVWLGRSSLWYRTDPLVTRAYLDAYDSIGSFYRGHGGWYYPGAYVAYAGATRLARRLAMASLYDWSQREFERYALAYGALAVANGTLVGRWTLPSDLAEGAAAAPAPPQLKPVEMPRVDTAAMSADERAAYLDVRDRFRSVSAHVHSSRVLLDQLSARLHDMRLELHPENAATALKMQGFLEDAAELVQNGEFETATDYLRRADAERTKLKSVTGQ